MHKERQLQGAATTLCAFLTSFVEAYRPSLQAGANHQSLPQFIFLPVHPARKTSQVASCLPPRYMNASATEYEWTAAEAECTSSPNSSAPCNRSMRIAARPAHGAGPKFSSCSVFPERLPPSKPWTLELPLQHRALQAAQGPPAGAASLLPSYLKQLARLARLCNASLCPYHIPIWRHTPQGCDKERASARGILG